MLSFLEAESLISLHAGLCRPDSERPFAVWSRPRIVVCSYQRTRKKGLLVLPYVSIVTEKTEWLRRVAGNEGYRVTAFHGIHGGDLDKCDIAVCTIEKANAIVSKLLCEGKMSELGIVVVDELHMLGEPQRGTLHS